MGNNYFTRTCIQIFSNLKTHMIMKRTIVFSVLTAGILLLLEAAPVDAQTGGFANGHPGIKRP